MNDDTTASASAVSDLTASIENAAGETADFVSENVGLVIAGGIAIGLIAASMMPRKKKRKITKKTQSIASVLSELSAALAAQASDTAGESRDKLQGLGKTISDTVAEHSQDIGKQAQQIASGAADQLNDGGKAIARAAVKLIEKVTG